MEESTAATRFVRPYVDDRWLVRIRELFGPASCAARSSSCRAKTSAFTSGRRFADMSVTSLYPGGRSARIH